MSGAEVSQLELVLAISVDELLRLYRGEAREVVARAEDGRVVRFPAHALRPFVRADGVNGRFRLRFDARSRLLELQRVETT